MYVYGCAQVCIHRCTGIQTHNNARPPNNYPQRLFSGLCTLQLAGYSGFEIVGRQRQGMRMQVPSQQLQGSFTVIAAVLYQRQVDVDGCVVLVGEQHTAEQRLSLLGYLVGVV